MKNLSKIFLLSLVISLILDTGILINDSIVIAQSTPKEELVQEIQRKAQRHVDIGKVASQNDLDNAFGDRGAQVGLDIADIEKIYEIAYQQAKIELPQSPFSIFKPQMGWLVAGILSILLVVRDVLKDFLSIRLKQLGEFLYNQFASSPLLQNKALKRYRRALVDKHQKLKIPFRINRPLEMSEIFVPLKVTSKFNDVEQIDSYTAIANYRRLMVIGQPGSGKTMMLKHIVLTYGRKKLTMLPDGTVPILLELHRLNDAELTEDKLIQEITVAFSRENFPNAERFVRKSLKQGRLMLLLDGLDEINSSSRTQVVYQIRELLDIYRQCRAIITCRVAVYNGEFSELADQTLSVVEFSDHQIHRFLDAWKEQMPSDKSVAHLMQTLQDRPRIIALARNPLLLTIIAYLYTDTVFILPHSRAEFYQTSTNILLEQWRREFNQYSAISKRRVLQHLALFSQERSIFYKQDRRSLNYLDVHSRVQQTLSSLNLDQTEDAAVSLILTEIVERSGLLLKIDGGENYQFAHLTLQEYFAAAALVDDSSGLIERWQKDPYVWRETAKLWCGLASNSTQLIQAIANKDKLAAFECLADAQQVDRIFSEQLIADFQADFNSDCDENVLRVFGIVAADPRSRGKTVFDFLEITLETHSTHSVRMAAAKALAFTNLPSAAKVLAKNLKNRNTIAQQIVKMGNVAIPALEAEMHTSKMGNRLAINCLIQIATPEAACKLVPLLWSEDADEVVYSAWGLAKLLPLAGVEDSLRRDIKPNSVKNQKDKRLTWILEPFGESSESIFSIIFERIAYILTHVDNLPEHQEILTQIDPRLCIACTSLDLLGEIKISKKWDKKTAKSLLDKPDKTPDWLHKAKTLIQTIDTTDKLDFRWKILLKCLPIQVQLEIINFLHNKTDKPNTNSWKNMFKRVEYDFEYSLHYRLSLLLMALLSVFSLIQIFILMSKNLNQWWTGFLSIGVHIILIFWLSLFSHNHQYKQSNYFHELGFGGLISFGIFFYRWFFRRMSWNESISLFNAASIVCVCSILMSLLCFLIGSITLAFTSSWSSIWHVILIISLTGSIPIVSVIIPAAVGIIIAAITRFIASGFDVFKSFATLAVVWLIVVIGALVWVWVWPSLIDGVATILKVIPSITDSTKVGVFVGALAGFGLIFWNAENELTKSLRMFSVFSLPWFCSIPIVLIFSTIGFFNLFEQQLKMPGLYGLILQGFLLCCYVFSWNYGQYLHSYAKNPFQGGAIEDLLRGYQRN